MNYLNRDNSIRLILAALILLTGVALVPFVDRPIGAINWRLFAGAYAPVLSANATSGAPGSVFAFQGSGYPPNSHATVSTDGRPIGTVMTDGNGQATFALDTTGMADGTYNVTMEVNINASATESITLSAGGPMVSPPPGFSGSTFFGAHVAYLPIIRKQ